MPDLPRPKKWDPFTEIRAMWHSRDTGGVLRIFSCSARTLKRPLHDVSLTAARALIVPEPAEDA